MSLTTFEKLHSEVDALHASVGKLRDDVKKVRVEIGKDIADWKADILKGWV